MPAPRFIRWIVKDWWLKLVALVAAVVLWLFARLEREYTRELKLGLDMSLLPTEYVVVDQNVDSVSVEIRGKGRYLVQLGKFEPKIVLPLVSMKEGRERLRIGPENVNLPEQIQVRSLDPYQIELGIERRAKRKVAVIVRSDGIPAEGFAISNIDYDKTVDLYGTKEVVSTFSHLFSEPLNVDGVSVSFSTKLAIQVPDTAGLATEPSSILVKVRVEPETTVVLLNVPVSLKGVPLQGQAYLLNKEAKLTLRGPVSLLRGYSKDEVEVTISVSSLTRGDYRLPADVSLAPGVRVESEPAVFRLLVR
ncbi:MAG: YbbR-like domain-containing protein [candidate division WOR-3 bacterium]|nr:YbbR-like domain-containing protein [candidate division WOR-3 bacterium]